MLLCKSDKMASDMKVHTKHDTEFLYVEKIAHIKSSTLVNYLCKPNRGFEHRQLVIAMCLSHILHSSQIWNFFFFMSIAESLLNFSFILFPAGVNIWRHYFWNIPYNHKNVKLQNLRIAEGEYFSQQTVFIF